MDPDHPKHNEMLGDIAKVAFKKEGEPIHFSWIKARGQRPLLEATRMLGSDIPTLLAISPKRMR